MTNPKDETEKSPLYSAVENADLEAVKNLIDKNTINNLISVPLYWRSRDGSGGGFVDLVSGPGNLLHLAAFRSKGKKNMPEVIRLLIESGANPNIQSEDVPPPLFIACNFGSGDAEKALIENGADVNIYVSETPLLFYYIEKRAFDKAVLVLNHGWRLDGSYGTDSLLLTLVYPGTEDIVKLLLEKGVNPNIPGGGKNTYPLAVANTLAKVKLLIEYGADIHGAAAVNLVSASMRDKRYDIVEFMMEQNAAMPEKLKNVKNLDDYKKNGNC